MIKLRRYTNIALLYFLIAALLGIFLRLFFVVSIPADFRYIVHAHSHIALLGWVYLALTTLIYFLYFSKNEKAKLYRRIFWFTNICLLGMMFSFPFQGYAAVSITFSTLFLFASYFFTWFFLKHVPEVHKSKYSFRCIKYSLWYLVISSIGPWAIGGVMATLGNTSIWYKLSIYFYLHFEYNAWFILALIGFFFYMLEKYNLKVSKNSFSWFFWLFNSGAILSLFLSALWVEPPLFIYILGGLGAILQVLAFLQLFSIFKNFWKLLAAQIHPFAALLLKLTAMLLIVKILLQLLTSIPYFADLSSLYTDFVITYLHWTFLGVITVALFGFLLHFRLLKMPKWIFSIYFIGFLLSEALILYKGLSFWQGWPIFSSYFMLLVCVSSLIPIALVLLVYKNSFSKH